MPTYLRDSTILKEKVTNPTLPPGCTLVTADATSMYTNIKTAPAFNEIKQFMQRNKQQHSHIPPKPLFHALKLVMENNIFTFGDRHYLQIKGTAMGTPAALPY
eukprot:12794576-Ditylum_brightwellii.AAC.1